MKELFSSPPIKGLILLIIAVAILHIFSMLTWDRSLEYKELSYRSPKITPELDSYTVAFLSDIHDYPLAKLADMVEQINSRDVDLVLLGGDMTASANLAECIAILSGIDASDGFYGVEGNHDNPILLDGIMREHDMLLLENRGVRLHPGLYIAGVEDLWTGYPDMDRALFGAHDDDFVLLLAHNADTTMERDVSRVDLTLSGHSHGGQITLFGLWAPAAFLETRYGQRFISGWCKSGWNTDVFVGRGIGSHPAWLPRVFARPQVIYLTLSGEATHSAQ